MDKNTPARVDPTAMGLFGLALVTLVASSQKLGLTSGTAGLLPWACFLGALLQLMACKLDADKPNMLGMTAFGAYGFFWLAMGMVWLIQGGSFGSALQQTYDPNQLGIAFVGYLILSIYLTIGAATTSMSLFLTFVAIDFLFIGLVGVSFGIAPHTSHLLAGVAELLTSILGFYGSAARIVNHQHGRVILPLGKAPCMAGPRPVKACAQTA
ncbi:acetate uptake transporter [Craterilacuibacter sp.]|uniref:acetate uptake transporter n=1 Tax=Craterilacuibacter sp. TaxID=2870909 RepID=UPI003F3E0E26